MANPFRHYPHGIVAKADFLRRFFMQVIYPQEYHDLIKIWQDALAEFSRIEIEKFNKKYSHNINPTQQERYEFERWILNNPFRDLCMRAICEIHNIYSPTYLLSKEEVDSQLCSEK